MAAASGEVESSAADASRSLVLNFFDENINTHL
jgi:hypothetical protein